MNDKERQGHYDLESAEVLTRALMHKIGCVALEKLLNLDGGGLRDESQQCAAGHHATYIEVRQKEVLTVLGRVRVQRNYYYDAACKKGWCPKDQELSIAGSSFSPGMRRIMGRVGSSRPFGIGAEEIMEIAGLEVSSKAIERICRELGKEAEQFLTVQTSVDNDSPDTIYISMDGTGVPVLKSQTVGRIGKGADGIAKTREAKLGCVFTQTSLDEAGYPIRDENSTTYVGAIESAEAFGHQINAEAERRGYRRAKRRCVIGDGSPWIWNIVLDYFWDAIQIVDVYHAREHYWECARVFFTTDLPRQQEWAECRKKELDHGDVEAVIRAVKQLRATSKEKRKLRDTTAKYFEQNKERMRYNKFRAQGLFVGSGVIEAGCKTVISQRLKQSGMHWTVKGANSIIALRCCLLSGRWEDFWTYIAEAA